MTLATRLQHFRFIAACVGTVIGLVFAQPATAQHATYALAWEIPAASGPVIGDNVSFDCATSTSADHLFLTITPTEDITGLLGIDGFFILYGNQSGGGGPNPVPLHPITPFWHFEDGGCNAGGLDIHVPTASIVHGYHPVFPSGSLFWLYAPDYQITGNAAIVMQLIDSQGLAVNLAKGKTYIVGQLDFSMCAGRSCDGCSDGFCVYPGYVRLEQDQSSADAVATSVWLPGINKDCTHFLASGEGSPPGMTSTRPVARMSQDAFSVQLGPAFKSVPHSTLECDGVPTKRHTWGTLKLLYR